tara:strand:- start:2737 stop:3387 length:651 start_codon:yes stop_codon:yes gene_type:complete
MKLITEQLDDLTLIVEETDGKKSLFIEGVFLQSDVKNKNGRMYPKEILEREVERYSKQYIKTKRAFGELGHPDGPVINLERVSHMITDLKEDGKNFVGKAKIMTSTPYGKIVESLLNEGAQLGVSSRGMGTLKQQKGINVVQDDFYLATAADIVADPSAPNAFVEGIMEGKEWVFENGVFKEESLMALREKLGNTKYSKDREELMLNEFNKLFSGF